MGLVGFDKRFLFAAFGAPGSTHDARPLRHTSLFENILNGDAIPDKHIELGDFGTVPLVTVRDNASGLLVFSRHMTTKQKISNGVLFNKRMRSAPVVRENAYGMLKDRWRILYRKTDDKF